MLFIADQIDAVRTIDDSVLIGTARGLKNKVSSELEKLRQIKEESWSQAKVSAGLYGVKVDAHHAQIKVLNGPRHFDTSESPLLHLHMVFGA